ncbi:hypothetical protein K435DRAFT_671718, partial [Dendrothele bispora CBS 962.96]
VGLYEFLTWCEDIGAEPIMVHGCLGWYAFIFVAQGDLQPYIQQAIDQVICSCLTTIHLCSRSLRL